jgi:hypothetical protein
VQKITIKLTDKWNWNNFKIRREIQTTCNCSRMIGTYLYKLFNVDLPEPECLEWKRVSTFFKRSMSSLDDVNVSNTWKRRLESENSIQLNPIKAVIITEVHQASSLQT